MQKTVIIFFVLLLLGGCSSSQFAVYRAKNSEMQWNITANRAVFGNKITIAINDSVVISDSPAIFSFSFESKGTYQGHEIKMYAVYNNGFLGIGAGWETTVYINNEMIARFKL